MNKRMDHDAFNLDRVLPREMYSDDKTRPTLVVMPVLSRSQRLVLTRLRGDEVSDLAWNSYILPQVEIKRGVTPREATPFALEQECGLPPDAIELMAPLGMGEKLNHDNTVMNLCFVVFVALRPNIHLPKAGPTSKSVITAGGPNNLWEKMKDARPERRKFTLQSVLVAVHRGWMGGTRWQSSKLQWLLDCDR